jgi:glycosyltransferase involved in cell wall biosynthesis
MHGSSEIPPSIHCRGKNVQILRRFSAVTSFSRLGVYQDGPFRVLEDGLVAPDPADAPFFRFVSGVSSHFESFTVFARVVADGEGADEQSVLPAGTRVVRLPDYGSLRRLGAVFGSGIRTGRAFWRGLDEVDVVWAFGPHPFELLLATLGALRGKRVVLGVRQDTPSYFRARLPSARWKPMLVGIDTMDAFHRLLARRLAATVVGERNARRYKRGRVLAISPSLVPDEALAAEPPERDWSGEVDLLTVGRIDSEKNPLLLVEAIAELERRRPGVFRLRWAGLGPLEDDVRARAAELGVADRIELLGYLPFPELLPHYRSAHAFVHVSFTEGVPQVLNEALACGLPVVATDVGGVSEALDGGRAGLLVPPADRDAVVDAVLRVADDEALRRGFVERGLAHARDRTLEAQAARVAAFLRDGG